MWLLEVVSLVRGVYLSFKRKKPCLQDKSIPVLMREQGLSGKQTDFGGEMGVGLSGKHSELSPELLMSLYCTKLKE